MKTHVFCTAVVCTLAVSGLASAQMQESTVAVAPPAAQTQGRQIIRESVFIADAPDPYRPHLTTPYGLSLTVGGGVSDFTGSTARDFTDLGGQWGARLAIGTRTFLGFEAAYVGTSRNVAALGLDGSAFLLSNGAEGLVRFNLLPAMWQPYIFGGAGWAHYSISNEDFNTSAVEEADDVFVVPMGGGVAMRYEGLVIDGRGTYRVTTDNDMFEGESMNSWGADLSVGWEF